MKKKVLGNNLFISVTLRYVTRGLCFMLVFYRRVMDLGSWFIVFIDELLPWGLQSRQYNIYIDRYQVNVTLEIFYIRL